MQPSDWIAIAAALIALAALWVSLRKERDRQYSFSAVIWSQEGATGTETDRLWVVEVDMVGDGTLIIDDAWIISADAQIRLVTQGAGAPKSKHSRTRFQADWRAVGFEGQTVRLTWHPVRGVGRLWTRTTDVTARPDPERAI
ncbi:hypothetical protein [Tersicoccus sp. Bi-70]|uniref:hypothetical protein n=1 Tax=Tersicoccus sp. Bi-70 TaxID=1897634 RepID=UPI000977D2F3|nr:hypothetical protein [Tersicoccus sp. Bi-70]OMH30618.1 hypothetical protein BGP79_11710 [Tersicoccus sp. Bi-70]